MDEKELNKKLDCLISKALEVIGKKASKDFEVASDADRTQNMYPPMRYMAQKTQYAYANEEIYTKLQKCFNGLETNEETEWMMRELIDSRYSLVIRGKQKAELETSGKEVMAAHKECNKMLAVCTEMLKKLLKLNLRLQNLDLHGADKVRLTQGIKQLRRGYEQLTDEFEACVTNEAMMLETQPNTGYLRACGWELT